MKTYWKFAALVVVIVGTLVWLAAGGISETKTYYITVNELEQLGPQAAGKRLRVAGDVEPGSIIRKGREVSFVLVQDNHRLKVVYNGAAPLPDTFRDGAQALADGHLGPDNVFTASQIQAKCASKYEAKPAGGKHPSNINKAGL
ncbi:MAG TPA: cytochrome c maturation protein CcmE [Bryobacteraceae bacterium]|nr:cytochrome c maturation protein CcmE [Bryobacteraceae bacterium]HOL70920.1 cytochrome c maturation protein CcmE [Bryobacteraceae bacterium]HOQ47122.1 cytochrome c maturation protein CcmE [Bryobacteraceae bacterium]HPU72489.1 cytochrome c maturation protein CcmE [Bryobacteraceae bacterium]